MGSGARVLVVDDEYSLRRLLRTYLEKEGFAVVEAENGLDAIGFVRGGNIDLALVDVMLPGLDGFEVVRRLRRESTIPIILLTARGEETSRVAGLEVGADDYVVKPFSAPEVVARVRAQLRRAQGFDDTAAPALYTGPVELDPGSRRCRVDGREVDLTRREFDLLATLMRSPNRVYRRDELLELVWGSEYLSPKTVDVHVAGLRRKLGTAVKITALRGVGYRLEL
ncbi:MAG: two-component system, OmpR family, response regulator MtrA [Gaiellaceae bacterium]|jgi:two-component system response regulator ResD|nr:two-component system, OmpR family, response regulator MtrA [Gaiellaceae bacterium]